MDAISGAVIGLGEFYTVLNNLCGFPIQDDAVLGNSDLIYYCGFSDCHLYCSFLKVRLHRPRQIIKQSKSLFLKAV
jgi:hypothetical protein